jgi:hypothetical protein
MKRPGASGIAGATGWRLAVTLLVVGGSVAASVIVFSRALRTRDTSVAEDGTRLAFLGATYGMNHSQPGSLWASWRNVVPEAVGARLGLARPWSLEWPKPALVLWFRVTGPTLRLWEDELNAFGLVDRTGVELRRAFGPDLIALPGPGRGRRERWWVLVTEAFPRRSARIGLRFYLNEGGELKRALETSFANPLRGVPPPWPAAPLPAVSRTNGLETTLTALSVTNARLPIRDNEFRWSPIELEARFRFSQQGQPQSDWTVSGLVLEDAAGNRAAGSVVGELARLIDDETIVCRANALLWPEEPTWKLRVEFGLRPGVVPEGYGFRLPPIAVPPQTGYTQIGMQTNVGAAVVQVLALVGDQATYPGREHDVFGRSTLELDVSPMAPRTIVHVVEALDDKGRPCEAMTQSVSSSGEVVIGLTIPADAQTVSMSIACYSPPAAELTVTSPWSGAGAKPQPAARP